MQKSLCMKKSLIWIILAVLIVAGIVWFYSHSTSASPDNILPDTAATPSAPVPITAPDLPVSQSASPAAAPDQGGSQGGPASATGAARDFIVIGRNYSFEPATITVKKGDPVHVVFQDSDGFHDLKIDGYNVATERIKTGGQSEVTFIADKVGSFEYYCSVGSHRALGMKGTLIVTP